MDGTKYLEYKNETIGENSFMKTLLKKRLNQKGLTLIELLAVIVILAIVAAIAIPAIGNLISNSRVGAIKGDALNVYSAANIYFTENSDETTADLTDLTTGGYLESAGSLTAAEVTKVSGGANTLSGAGNTGGVTITFTAATQDDVSELENNDPDGTEIGSPARVELSR